MKATRIALVAGMAMLLSVAGVALAGRSGGASPPRIVVSDTGCGPGWAPRSGRTTFAVRNTAPHDSFTVQVVSAADPVLARLPLSPENGVKAANAPVLGEVATLAPHTEVPLDVVLPPGRYFVRCLDSNGNTLDSKVVHAAGAPAAAHPYSPVTPNQLAVAMQSYRLSLQPLLRRLQADTDRLTRAVRAGKLGTARALWLPAHLDYARLGVAYGTFGNLDGEIDGRPLGLQGGVGDPHFTGFLRLEYGLWHDQPASELEAVASVLDRAVHTLVRRTSAPGGVIWVNSDLPLRAHEILENTLQFELTGETDEGSHTNLATAWANVQGESLALVALTPLLHVRDPRLLADATGGARRLASSLEAYRRSRWLPLASLSTPQRERLDSETSALLETLERIPDELQPALIGPSADG